MLMAAFSLLIACSNNSPDIIVYEDGTGECVGGPHSPDGLRWRNQPVKYYIDTESFGSDASVFEAELSRVIMQAQSVSGLRMIRVDNISLANIRYTRATLDGRGGTLAVAYQASGNFEFMDDHQVMTPPFVGDVIFDLRENWTRKSLHDVGLHETLHAVGVAHSENQGDVMYPAYIGQDTLQDWDTEELVLRYGKNVLY